MMGLNRFWREFTWGGITGKYQGNMTAIMRPVATGIIIPTKVKASLLSIRVKVYQKKKLLLIPDVLTLMT